MRRSRETALTLAERLAKEFPDVCAVRRGMVFLAAEQLWKPHALAFSEIRNHVQHLEQSCVEVGIFPSYFGINTAFVTHLNEQFRGEYRSTPLGAESVWNLVEWQKTQANNKTVRNSIHAALRLGLEVREHSLWEVMQTHCLTTKFRSVLHDWQIAKRLPPLGFVAESDIFQAAVFTEQQRRLFGVWRGEVLLGYVSGYSRSRDSVWYVDQFIRHPAAPLGAMELCIDTAFRAVWNAGVQTATLGLMPLARINIQENIQEIAAFSLNNNFSRLLRLSALCGRHWYNTHGLTRFKQKFMPHYTSPMFFCSHRSLSALPLALGLVEAFCGMAWYNSLRYNSIKFFA